MRAELLKRRIIDELKNYKTEKEKIEVIQRNLD